MKGQAKCAVFIAALGLSLFSCGRMPSEETLSTYLKAASYFDEGKFAEALDASAAIASFPPAAILRGKAFFFRGDAEHAEISLRTALKKKPSSTEARIVLARVLRARGKKAESGREIERVLGDDPDNAGALRLAAQAASDREDLRASAAFLDRAAEAGTETALAFLDRARLRWVLGEKERALADIHASVAILPPESAAYRAALALEKTIREATL